jgi:hypothetical protein
MSPQDLRSKLHDEAQGPLATANHDDFRRFEPLGLRLIG